MSGAIETFLDEVREAGKVRGLMTEDHVEIVRSALVNGYNAASESAELMGLWDAVHDVITDRSKSVRQRLRQMGVVAERWDEKQRGRSN